MLKFEHETVGIKCKTIFWGGGGGGGNLMKC